ncbi:hypothetical protein D9611_003872 [Ephemerocybe angulata]|uniref:Uncharacterized protein n=1 Tax=Ephemerocybe angulata TaxID=980116 RepID=A0A8H5EYD7_9AGAR|nr:hypothetical protein D9611_003872 [Tulosesus angulatus]
MPIPTAPALLVGLGARILLNTVNRGPGAQASIPESILLGVWQGVGLQYAGKQTGVAIAVGAAIAMKLLYDFTTTQDVNICITTIIGVLLGVVGTELLSSYIDQYFGAEVEPVEPRKRTRSLPSRYPSVVGHHLPKPTHARTVQFGPDVLGGSVESEVNRPPYTLVSELTSIDSSAYELQSTASPVEREIASLRARASLADSERRRYREERKWAMSQGNLARAEQMKSEYKRYKTLMESCHREADMKLLAMEAAKERGSRHISTYQYPRDESPPPDRRPPPQNVRRAFSKEPSPRREKAPYQIRIPTQGGPSSQPSPTYQEYKAAQQRRASSARQPRDPYR